MSVLVLCMILFAGLNIGTTGWLIHTFDLPAWWFEIAGFVMLLVPAALVKSGVIKLHPWRRASVVDEIRGRRW